MQKDFIAKIDLLVEMSGTTNTYDALSEELNLLEKKIENQKNKVRNLKKSISDNKYMKASDRIIDENVKIGIENKIAYYEENLTKIKEQIDAVSKEEEATHQEISFLTQEQEQLKRFLESLELKLKTIGSKDKSIYSFYEKLIESTREDIEKNESSLKDVQKHYQGICDQLEQLGNKREDLENKLSKEEERLKEIQTFLANPNSYVDQKAKKNDEKLIDDLTRELEQMEHRKVEILTDAAYLGHEIVELFMDEDNMGALNKTKELVQIVNQKPYMEYDLKDLDDLLESATNERDTYVTHIENENYESSEMSVVTSRLHYLKEEKAKKEKKIAEIEEEVKELDTTYIQELMKYVDEARENRDALKLDISEYEQVIRSHQEFKSPKKEASLHAALKKKKEEFSHVENLVTLFEKDLENTVIYSRELEEKELKKWQEKLQEIEQEIREIEKSQVLISHSKDILAVERDKEELKRLNDVVLEIQRRQNYAKKPDEIYDEIELMLGSMEEESVHEEDKNTDDFVDLDDYRIDLTQEEPIIETQEEPVVEEVVEDKKEEKPVEIKEEETTPVLDDTIFEPVENEPTKEDEVSLLEPVTVEDVSALDDIVPVFPEPEETEEVIEEPLRTVEETAKVEPERLKVIQVEPLMVEQEKDDEIDSLPVLDDDDEYISFDHLLEEDMNDENSN